MDIRVYYALAIACLSVTSVQSDSPDPCASNPCYFGECSEVNGGDYTCRCHDGEFSQTGLCDDPCEENPCAPYNCRSDPSTNVFQCLCPVATEPGSPCNSPPPCNGLPCQNGGSCEDLIEPPWYVCTCEEGFTGEDCEEELSACDSEPCENGGDCIPGPEYPLFQCLCDEGFTGEVCEEKILQKIEIEPDSPYDFEGRDVELGGYTCLLDATCNYHGECVTTKYYYYIPVDTACLCDQAYTGDHCETPLRPEDEPVHPIEFMKNLLEPPEKK